MLAPRRVVQATRIRTYWLLGEYWGRPESQTLHSIRKCCLDQQYNSIHNESGEFSCGEKSLCLWSQQTTAGRSQSRSKRGPFPFDVHDFSVRSASNPITPFLQSQFLAHVAVDRAKTIHEWSRSRFRCTSRLLCCGCSANRFILTCWRGSRRARRSKRRLLQRTRRMVR
jgi:hypothetical protein